MIKEDFVSFEVAKLLKENGFNANDCKNSPDYAYDKKGVFSHPLWDTEYPAPTLQMAAKWLREEHNLSIDNTCSANGFYCSVVHIVKDKSGRIIDVEDSADWETPYCKTFEEAFDKALKFCLERMLD